ncbi:hypothetical protein [Fredinandcohnia quinoae]|uniref:Uncharacterized protein n=1 Tax=Fredinandcohnia quinoae TaxID=2918902 RepID=A0AAW5E3E0_9BACI|nr:hypothetical protein [Fredinandcohnia sp. SECRCQ15]MCH1625309.1 hypothetical protein [Fredinandcohnia sp. SECRCQ15]
MAIILKRKIVTAILSCFLFAIIFSIPNVFDLNLFLNLFYMSFILVITYGVITSSISDWISNKIFTSTYAREITSFVFHCFFGLVFLLFSLAAAILFFVVDRLLKKVKIRWWVVLIGLLVVALVFIINII